MNDDWPDVPTVFIVQYGEYSGRFICSVWTTLEEAQKAAGDSGDIEQWVLNEREEKEILVWRAFIDRDDTIRVEDKAESRAWIEAPNVQFFWSEYLRRKAWTGSAYGPSPDHARKILADAWAKAKAEQENL